MTPTLVLIRHAPTPLNRERRDRGHLDPDLGPDGERAARRLRRWLARLRTLRVGDTLASSLPPGSVLRGPLPRGGA